VNARRWWLGTLMAAAFTVAAGGPARAQTVVAQIGGQLVARSGQTIDVPVTVDLSGAPGVRLGSYRSALRFDPNGLLFAGVVPGTFADPLVNADSASGGLVRFTAVLPAGAPGPVVTLFVARFYVSMPDTTATAVTLSFDEMSAAGMPFTNLLPFLQAIPPAVVCPSIGTWGDVDGDGSANSRDALVALSRVVGMALDTTYLDTLSHLTRVRIRPSLADVDGDGQVTSRDALIIMSHAVGLPVAGYRIGVAAAGACGAAAGFVLRITPDTVELQSAQSFTPVVTAQDSAGRSVAANDVRWTSSNPAVASLLADYSGVFRIVARDSGWAVISAEVGAGHRASAVVHVIAHRSQWYVDIVRAGQTAYVQQVGDGRLPFAYVQDALDLARDLDTINVASGVYPEAASSDISVFLRGDSLQRPVLDPRAAQSYFGGPALRLGSRVGVLRIENVHAKGGGIAAYAHAFVGRNLRVDSVVVGEFSDPAAVLFSSVPSMPSGGAVPPGALPSGVPEDTGSVSLDGIDVRGFATRGIWIVAADSVVIQHASIKGDSIPRYGCSPGVGDFGGIIVDQAAYSRLAFNSVTDSKCSGIAVFQAAGRAVLSGNRVVRAGIVGIHASAPQVDLDHNSVRDVPSLTRGGAQSAGIHVSNLRPAQSVTSLADTVRHVGAAGFLVDSLLAGTVDSLVVDSTGMDAVPTAYGAGFNGGRLTVRYARISNTLDNGLNLCGPTASLFSRGNRITRPGYNGISTWDCRNLGNGPDTLISVADTVSATYANTGTGIRAADAVYARVDSAVVSGADTNLAMGIGFYGVGYAVLRSSNVRSLAYDGAYVYGGAGALLERDTLTAVGDGLFLHGATDTVRVRQSVVMNAVSSGIVVHLGTVIRADTIVVSGSGTNASGMSFDTLGGGRITGSRLEGNRRYGLHVSSTNGAGASLVLRGNSLAANDSGGVRSLATPVDAQLNWWGQAGGPVLDTAAVNSFSVVGLVDFANFLTSRPTFPLAPALRPAPSVLRPVALTGRAAPELTGTERQGRGALDRGVPSALPPSDRATAAGPLRPEVSPLVTYRKGAQPRPAVVHHPH
jgi:hypothetical protein